MKTLRIAPDLALPAETAATETFGFLAKRRAGPVLFLEASA